MAPWRRSTILALFSPDTSNNHDPWSAEIHLLRSDLGPLPYTTVWLVSEFLILVALLVFLPGACTTKQSSCGATSLFPSLALIGSLVSYILSQILSVILLLVYFLEATVKQSYVVAGILQMIFRLVALLLLCYVLYRVVQGAVERISFPKGGSVLVARGHWVILGILSSVVIANCTVRIVSVVRMVESGPDDGGMGISVHDNRLTTSRAVLFMITSVEILLWAIFSIVKSPSGPELSDSQVSDPHPPFPQPATSTGYHRKSNQLPSLFPQTKSISLITSSLSYLTLTLTTTIRTIRYVYLHVPEPKYLHAACAVVEFFSLVGLYTSLIIYFTQLEKDEEVQLRLRQNRLRRRLSSERKSYPYIPYRPSIGEVLGRPAGPSNKVFGMDGTCLGGAEEAVMSGGR